MTTSANTSQYVSVIGLGNMGSALAQAFIAQGHRVTLWNRTAAKATPLVQAGAALAKSAADAVAASPVSVLCLTDMSMSKQLMRTPDLSTAAKGKTIIDLSTGTPDDAVDAAQWAASVGVRYVDGGILCYPRDIGRPHAAILFGGDGAAYRAHEATLGALGGALSFVGEAPDAAATVYLALWTFYFGSLVAYFEAGGLAASVGVTPDRFLGMAVRMTKQLNNGMEDASHRAVAGNLAADQASIDLTVEGVQLIQRSFARARLQQHTVDACLAHMAAAQKAGDGGKDIAAALARAVKRPIAGTDISAVNQSSRGVPSQGGVDE